MLFSASFSTGRRPLHNALQDKASRALQGRADQMKARRDEAAVAAAMADYNRNVYVGLVRSMVAAGSAIKLVGLSAIASSSSGSAPCLWQQHSMPVSFEGEQYIVPCSYSSILFQDLVVPVTAELLHVMEACGRGR